MEDILIDASKTSVSTFKELTLDKDRDSKKKKNSAADKCCGDDETICLRVIGLGWEGDT